MDLSGPSRLGRPGGMSVRVGQGRPGALSAGLVRCMLVSRPTIFLAKYARHAEPGPPAGLPDLKFNAV